MARKNVKDQMNYTYPFQLGVNLYQDRVVFRVAVPNAKECFLRLYDSSTDNLLREYQLLEEERVGDVFSIAILQTELVGDCYRYMSSEREFIDPYANRILGREEFGQVKKGHSSIYGGWNLEEYDWGKDQDLMLEYQDMLIYKLHVRGYTMNPNSGVRHKGTYQGIVEKLPYLKELGVNAVLLMPCIEFNEILYQENIVYGQPKYAFDWKEQTEGKYKINFWGYTTDAYYFAPKASYANEPKNCINEFKAMVKQLHKNGIEVLLDMFFSQSFCPSMILDCLRFWKLSYHIDGFHFNGNPGIVRFIATDPFFARTKLLYQEWDTKEIYQQTEPKYRHLAEYNDGFLIDIRRFINADGEQVPKFVQHFKKNPRKCAAINYLADQNGFTLADLYSYDVKHNEANEENNQDGTDYNYSTNCGVEGRTTKKSVKQLRQQMMYNALLILLLSQGTPMLQAGDEFGNSQQGNNNAYCQDNEIGWVDWTQRKGNKALFDFTKKLIELRKMHPVFHNSLELKGSDYIASGCPDISFHGRRPWYPEYENYSRLVGVLLNGEYAVMNTDLKDVTCYLLFNMHWEEHNFDIPDVCKLNEWELVCTTADGFIEKEKLLVDRSLCVKARSIAVLIERKIN